MYPGTMGMGFSRADARAFSGKAGDDPRVLAEALPLPKRFFSKLRLSSSMVRGYQHTAKALLDDALEQLRRERVYGGIDETLWRDIGPSNGFKRYTKTEGDAQHFRVQGTVRATLSGLMRVMFAESDRRLLERRKALYNDVLDAQTLCVLKDRSNGDNEHMAIRWLAIELSASSDANRRDMCVLEYTGTTTDWDNQPIGFKVTHSIQIAECHSLESSHGLLRRVGSDVLLIRPSSDNGHSELILSGSSDVASDVGSWHLSSYLSTIAAALGKLPVVVQERCLANMPLLDKTQWVSTSDRKSCHVCVAKFGYLSKKHNCRACGDVTCKSCIVTRSVGVNDESKFCKKCIIVATSERSDVDPTLMRDRSDASSLQSRSSITSVTSQCSSIDAPMFQQASKVPSNKFHVDMKLLEEVHYGSNNSSFAATDSSYGSSSTASSLDLASGGGGGSSASWDARAAAAVSSLDEDNVMFVDTRDMQRQFDAIYVGEPVGHSNRGGSSQQQSRQQSRQHHHQPSYTHAQPQQPQQQRREPKFHTAPGGYSSRSRFNAVPPPPQSSMYNNHQHGNNHTNSSRGGGARVVPPSPVAPSTSFQDVEDSIAHQRQLLEKMMHQARYKAPATAAAYQ